MIIRMRTILNRFFIILFTLIVVALLLSTSCTMGKSETKIHSVKLIVSASVNWDEDNDADGVQFLLIPTDTDGWPIREELLVSASLWSQLDRFNRERGDLIQEWRDVRITKRTYERYGEARVCLEYSSYVPEPDEYGILDVTVQTEDGRSFSFEEIVGLRYSPNQQGTSGCCF
jgi:hypothetical protein